MEVNPNLSEKAQIDFKLVQLAVQGDQKAYAELLSRYKDSIYFMLLKMVNNRDDAEDLTQMTFLRAYRAFDRYDPTRPFEHWLMRITANLFVDYLRRRRRRVEYSLDAPVPTSDGDGEACDIPDSREEPQMMLMKDLMDERIEAALDNLPAVYRQAVLLTDVADFTYDEAAAAVGCPIGTLRSRVHRGRNMLRTQLGAA